MAAGVFRVRSGGVPANDVPASRDEDLDRELVSLGAQEIEIGRDPDRVEVTFRVVAASGREALMKADATLRAFGFSQGAIAAERIE
jgi:hypothetical protein